MGLRVGRYDMKILHKTPQRTALHDLYDSMSPLQRKVAFSLGAIMVGFVILASAVHLYLYLFHAGPEHEHVLLDVKFIGWMIAQFLMGSSLMMPSQTLALIAIIPLPPFLRRSGASLTAYTGPDRRAGDTGPPTGTADRRSGEQGADEE